MMMMIESASAVRFSTGGNFCSSSVIPYCRHSLEEATVVPFTTRRFFYPGGFDVPWKKSRRCSDSLFLKRSSLMKNIRASAEHLGSASDPSKPKGGLQYHPFEEISKSTSENNGETSLAAEETARTIVEVNNKATLMFTGLIDDDVHENIVWPDLPYVTDEQGNIYFQVKNDEDMLQSLTPENNFVQAIVGFDAMEMLSVMEAIDDSEIDFGIEDDDSDVEDDENEDEDDEDDYDEDLIAVVEDEDEDDTYEVLGDWAKLETMRASHPMYFAKKLTEVASDDPIDWMQQHPAGLAIQGLIRPALIEEQSEIRKHRSFFNQSNHGDAGKNEGGLNDVGAINGHKQELTSENVSVGPQEPGMDEVPRKRISLYKLETIKIQLVSAHGQDTTVEVEDFRRAQPDIVALSASKIMSHLKAGGDEVTQAFKSLCWRLKGIQVEEAAVIGIDSLGFDLRVCSGTQIQTLRFSFNSRATSEHDARRLLNDLLFPTIHQRMPKRKQAHQNEL
ncbi:hypothetical protein K2173_008729 [Erythroxylum novogranatense]|uniref:DUF2470 domain-containing protein n=1 Tax=Erythroxylum novogranatense TaxID=1862640 RepID=A0AAV8SLU6_9ROSI|nr:hypothetical protein K2173_008729 [Erythroxylum novogranatense]